MNANVKAVGADMVVIAIREVYMHKGAHWDEIVGDYQVRHYGTKFFTGVDKAPLRFVPSIASGLTDADFDKDGVLPIGCGMGRFDEHRSGIERLPNECSATLVAKYLGISDRLELKRLLEETLWADAHSGVQVTQMPELIKVANRMIGWAAHAIVKWAWPAIRAIINQERYRHEKLSSECSIVDIFRALVEKGHYKDEKSIQYIYQRLHDSEKAAEYRVTELAFVVRAMFRQGVKRQDIEEWLRFPLDHFYNDQLAYWAAIEECKEKACTSSTMGLLPDERNHWVNKTVKVGMIHTDALQAMKAMRYVDKEGKLGCYAYAIRNSKKQVQIFTNLSVRGLTLKNVVAMIRWLEIPQDKKNSVSWEDLMCKGAHPLVPDWYYHESGFMNGSPTHPDVKATAIGSSAIMEVLKSGFHPEGVKRWKADRKIGGTQRVEQLPDSHSRRAEMRGQSGQRVSSDRHHGQQRSSDNRRQEMRNRIQPRSVVQQRNEQTGLGLPTAVVEKLSQVETPKKVDPQSVKTAA